MKTLKYINIAIFATVMCPMLATAQNAYISRVYEYLPAPGQFVNTMPEYEDGDTEATMAQKAEETLANNARGMISLGGFGGYIVFGFDHRVENVEGHYDFNILGNAFYASSNPNPDASPEGGSSEPGIVMVSRDDNNNGLPDDKWYELAGSEYHKSTTIHNYTLTYYRTPFDHVATPVKSTSIIDDTYIAWHSSKGENGYVYKNAYHKQDYYPQWIKEDKLSFTGTILPNNAVDESGDGSYYVLYCYGYGYADNHPNNDPNNRSKFNIEWAVDENGKQVSLDGIDFVKVYTALNQYAGNLGETSTEIQGAADLHIIGGDDEDVYFKKGSVSAISTLKNDPSDTPIIFNILGQRVDDISQPGIYIIHEKGRVIKKIIH